MTHPPKILITNSGRRWIGEVAHCLALYDALDARGGEPWLACRSGTPLEERARERGLRHVSLDFADRFSPIRDGRDVRALARLIRGRGIQILHAHRGKDHWTGLAAARMAGVPVVRTRHVVTPVRPHVFNRWLYHSATAATISVSAAAEASFGILREGMPVRRVILSAVDQVLFSPAKRSDAWRRAAAGVEPDPLWVGLIARWQRVKGQRHFMEAAARVIAEIPNARFLLAGRGGPDKRKWCEEFARENGIADRFRFEGWLPDVHQAVASLDVGVVASVGSEGSSRAALEMMASGIPVVATTVGSLPELLTGSDMPPSGLIVPPRDAEAMAEGIIRLLADAELRRTLAGAGLERVRARHTIDHWIGQIESVYREALALSKE